GAKGIGLRVDSARRTSIGALADRSAAPGLVDGRPFAGDSVSVRRRRVDHGAPAGHPGARLGRPASTCPFGARGLPLWSRGFWPSFGIESSRAASDQRQPAQTPRRPLNERSRIANAASAFRLRRQAKSSLFLKPVARSL